MGMYDTVYAELDCPFCGRQYRYSPMSREDAEREVKQHKEWQIESRQKFLRGERAFYLQDVWAKRDGFDDIDTWIDQLDTPDKIEAYRTERSLGLAQIPTKEFECMLEVNAVLTHDPETGKPAREIFERRQSEPRLLEPYRYC